jgi:pSer/pThr/pTyr-binding forkhead associated (FHA) protein
MHGLYTFDGKLLVKVDKASVTFGKKKEEVDVVLDDVSVSRMHARILRDGEKVLLEDLNSTNGTYKNGLRMEPYERRALEVGDEIRIGTQELVYR